LGEGASGVSTLDLFAVFAFFGLALGFLTGDGEAYFWSSISISLLSYVTGDGERAGERAGEIDADLALDDRLDGGGETSLVDLFDRGGDTDLSGEFVKDLNPCKELR